MAETTRKIQQYKSDAVAKLKEHLAAAPDLIFSDFRGLSFPQMTDLRAKLTEKGTAYRVVRNSFVRIAMQEAGLPDASGMLEGPTALAFLGQGRYRMTLIQDGKTPRSFDTQSQVVESNGSVTMNLDSYGGFAAVLRPQ